MTDQGQTGGWVSIFFRFAPDLLDDFTLNRILQKSFTEFQKEKMLSQFASGSDCESATRVFTYEVQGLRQNDKTEVQDYEVRRSGSIFVNVPYGRMNDEMQRITRLGGKIVSIKPYDGALASAE